MTKNILTYFTALAFVMFGLFSCSSAPVQTNGPKLTYSYSSLKLMDLDMMTGLIQNQIQRYKKTGNEELINEAIVISLSRPNEDGLAEKLLDIVRFSLESPDLWEKSVEQVVQKSVTELKSETTAGSDQVTYLILLENLVSEFKPQFVKQYQSPKFESAILERIAQADIQVSDAAIAEGRLYMMKEPVSPSTLAQSLLNERNQKLNPKK